MPIPALRGACDVNLSMFVIESNECQSYHRPPSEYSPSRFDFRHLRQLNINSWCRQVNGLGFDFNLNKTLGAHIARLRRLSRRLSLPEMCARFPEQPDAGVV